MLSKTANTKILKNLPLRLELCSNLKLNPGEGYVALEAGETRKMTKNPKI